MSSASKNVLVTGSRGQLGSELQQISSAHPQYHFFFTDKNDLPIDDIQKLDDFFNTNKIGHCINAAAYTAVDNAEQNIDLANIINGTAIGYLAATAKKYGASLIHISTDYVFDGNGTTPYKESDMVSPVNAYGASKLLGENLALQENPDTIVIRTSWLYSSFGNNFVKTMRRLMKDRAELNVVSDQIGCPTYAADLAEVIVQIIPKLVPESTGGIYQFSNQGVISWFDFAKAIAEISLLNCKINPIPSSSYPTPAARPKYSVMDNSKLKDVFGITQKPWKESLERCIALMD